MAGMMGLQKAIYERVEAKTADYYITARDIGKILTNRGATGAVTFYLPDVGKIKAGWNVRIFIVADQTVTVSATVGTDDELVVWNDAAADSLAFSTASMKIGNGVEIVFDGTGFLAFIYLGSAETTTVDIPVIAT